MSLDNAGKLVALIMAVLVPSAGVIRYMISLRSGGDVVADLRTQLAEAKQEIKDLKLDIDKERADREHAENRHREDLDSLRREHRAETDTIKREHRAEIDGLQREVRDLYASRTQEA